MNNKSHEIILKTKRYFKRLWDALLGRDPFCKEREGLTKRIDAGVSDLQSLRLIYNSALEKWKQQSDTVRKQEEIIADLQKVIEVLRSSTHDKDAELVELRQRFLEQLERDRTWCDKRIATYTDEIIRLKQTQEASEVFRKNGMGRD